MSKRCSVVGCNKTHSARSRSECKECYASNMETTKSSTSEQHSSTEQTFTFSQPIYSQFGTMPSNSMFLASQLPQQQQQQHNLSYAGLPQHQQQMQHAGPQISDASPNELRLVALMQQAMKPLEQKIDKIHDELLNRVTSLETRVDLIEKNDDLKNGELSRIKDTVVNMQHALNTLDSEERSKNIIIAGLSEENIISEGITFTDDLNKVSFLLEKMKLNPELVNGTTLTRLGTDTTGSKRRFMKLELPNKDIREKIIKATPKLKDLPEPWNKVYFNRDTHPVYQKEHKRLRKKFNELKAQGNPDSVKLVKGVLTVDDNIVDKNIFLN